MAYESCNDDVYYLSLESARQGSFEDGVRTIGQIDFTDDAQLGIQAQKKENTGNDGG